MGSRRREGFVLIVICGMVGLLLLVCMSFVGTAAALSSGADAAGREARAALSAQSGMEYAACRLRTIGMPRFSPTPVDRGDDWAFRDDPRTPLERSLNPSWAHGPSWADLSEVPDLFDNDLDGELDEPGEVDRILAGGDAEAGGGGASWKPSAWTGRLRGGSGTQGVLFRLRVESPEGKIPVNHAAYSIFHDVGLIDANGDGTADNDNDKDGIPDLRLQRLGRTVLHGYGVARILNHLGVILLDPLTGTRRWDLPVAGGTRPSSWLGHDLALLVPSRGRYASLREVQETLEGMMRHPLAVAVPFYYQGGPYRPDEAREILRFLDLGPYDVRPTSRGGESASISLLTAPREVLAAAWMFWKGGNQEIQPVEAFRLADAAIACRQQGGATWKELRGWMLQRAPEIFREVYLASAASPDIALSAVWRKADLAYQAVVPSQRVNCGLACGSAAWAAGYAGPDLTPSIALDEIQMLAPPKRYVPSSVSPRSPAYPDVAPGWLGGGYWREPAPVAFTWAPPIRFSIESLGLCAGAGGPGLARSGGDLRTGEVLEISGQRSFEHGLSVGPPRLLRSRFILSSDGGDGEADRRDCPGSTKHSPRIVLFPYGSLFSAKPAPLPGFADSSGGIGLGTRKEGRNGAALYWPLTEDFDRQANLNAPPPWEENWSEWSTSYPWAPSKGKPPYRLFTSGVNPCLASGSATKRGPFIIMGVPKYLDAWIQWPGWGTPFSPDAVTAFSVEAVFSPDSEISFKVEGRQGTEFVIRTRRGWKPTRDRPGTFFEVNLVLQNLTQKWIKSRTEWFIPDSACPGGVPAWSYRTLLTMERKGKGTKLDPHRFLGRLYVNGSDLADEGTMLHLHPDSIAGIWNAFFTASNLDEIRLYDRVVSHEIGDRHVRRGSFTSPEIGFQGDAVRLGLAQWEGVIPPGYGEPVTVELEALSGSGVPVAQALLRKGMGAVEDLAALGLDQEIRALRYKVRLDCSGAPSPLLETPLFESIWISFRREGAGPAWTAWETR